jgi:hypothetical protein
MHRPGIASVEGDCFVLNGTTVEEVEQYHAKTLKLVVERANQEAGKIEQQEQEARERAEKQAQSHQDNVTDVAKRIKFD